MDQECQGCNRAIQHSTERRESENNCASECVCVCVRACVCACVCVCVRRSKTVLWPLLSVSSGVKQIFSQHMQINQICAHSNTHPNTHTQPQHTKQHTRSTASQPSTTAPSIKTCCSSRTTDADTRARLPLRSRTAALPRRDPACDPACARDCDCACADAVLRACVAADMRLHSRIACSRWTNGVAVENTRWSNSVDACGGIWWGGEARGGEQEMEEGRATGGR